MATFFEEPSRTFSEYLLVPGYSDANCTPEVTFTVESREALPSVKWLIDEGYLNASVE